MGSVLASNESRGAEWISQVRVNRVRGILKSYGFSAGYRVAARLAGNDFGHPFNRHEELSEQELKDLEQKLKNEKLI